MEKTRSFFMMAVFLAGGFLFLSPRSARASQPFSIQIPSYATDLSDLDVRDHQNRKINSPSQKNQLQNIFEASLNGLILHNLTPTKRDMQIVLAQTWNLSFGWFSKVIGRLFGMLVGWINPNKGQRTVIAPSHLDHVRVNPRWRPTEARTYFHWLIPTLLSSTTLLR